ncbi:hypothetical protein BT67DRAFT_453038 [Trichocladium antarcticum]|uniref:Alpha and gamma adaptin binding protein p34 n=1 Tax=Trichocladium antarcticum TaxID=1450529 RepID=A0AAN6USW2_9PEZI|nr:hypothetical protein BT67DRAFT_453038 [Trichocladium antarcticum]
MEIPNPRRILAVSLADSAQHLSDVLKDLTGTTPSPPPAPSDPPGDEDDQAGAEPTLAGTTHPLALTTQYYTATVPIWLDLIPAAPSPFPSAAAAAETAAADWAATFLSPDAREVLAVLGGVVLVFALPPSSSSSSSSSPPPPVSTSVSVSAPRHHQDGGPGDAARELVRQVGRVVRQGLGGWEWDGVALAVGVGEVAVAVEGDGDDGELDAWEDLCAGCGLEFVHVSRAGGGGEGRNAFGERTGVARVLEALQANDWSAGGGGDEEEEEEEDEGEGGEGKGREGAGDEGGGFGLESLDFGLDGDDCVGLQKAIWAGGRDGDEEDGLGDQDVQKLERMMRKLQAVKDATAGLPEEQRKRMAKRAVGEVMKEL